MKITDLFPVDDKGIGWEVFDILSLWLCEINGLEHFDIKAGGKAIRLMAAFRALENDGTAKSFKEALYWTPEKQTPPQRFFTTRPI